jgi:RNA-binding protein
MTLHDDDKTPDDATASQQEVAPEGLTGKQRRFLRGLGHNLSPAIYVGKEGISEAVVAALDEALLTHELVKVKLGQNAVDDRDDAASALAAGTASHIAQVLGNTILVYRRHPEKPRLKLP